MKGSLFGLSPLSTTIRYVVFAFLTGAVVDIFHEPSAFDLVEPIVDHFSPFLVWRRIVTPALTGSIVPFIENFAPSETSAGG